MSASYPDNPFSVPGQAPPPKKGMSTFLKVVLILFGLAGVSALVCCGVVGSMAYAFFPILDKAKIKETTQSIVSIEVPAAFEPLFAIDYPMFKLKMVMFGMEEHGQLMLMQTPPGQANEGTAAQIRERLEKDQKKGKPDERVVFEDKIEKREYTINGEKVEFNLRRGEGEKNNLEYVELIGTFPGKGGSVLLTVVAPTSVVSEADLEKMIQSIKN